MAVRLRRAWLALLGIGAAAPVAAQEVPAAAAPAAWVRYGEQATVTVTGWLQAGDPAAVRLRDTLGRADAGPEGKPAALPLKLWIDPDGRIARIDFPRFPDAGMDRDLQALIVGRSLAARPPRGIRMPLRVILEVTPDGAD